MNQNNLLLTPDSPPEIIAAFGKRIKLTDEDTIYITVPPKINMFIIELTFKRIGQLIDKNKPNYFLINLSDSPRPTAAQRARIRALLNPYTDYIKFASIYTEKNKFLNLIAKFVLGGVGFKKYAIHVKKEEALKAINHVKNK